MAAMYLKNRTLETPLKMLHSEKADFSHLCVIGARTFVHMKDSRKLDVTA